MGKSVLSCAAPDKLQSQAMLKECKCSSAVWIASIASMHACIDSTATLVTSYAIGTLKQTSLHHQQPTASRIGVVSRNKEGCVL